jgi:hypothetical protein
MNWTIENKIVPVVSDKAANRKSAIQNRTLWKIFGCYVHTLKLVDNLVGIIKTTVSHLKRNATATSKLINFQTKKITGHTIGTL